MSLISDAFKTAIANEKLIKRQQTEISALKAKVEELLVANAALRERVKAEKEAASEAKAQASKDLREVRAAFNLHILNLTDEIKKLTEQVKSAKNADTESVGENIPKKRGRKPKSEIIAQEQRIAASASNAYQAKDHGMEAPDVRFASKDAPVISAKGFTYEYA